MTNCLLETLAPVGDFDWGPDERVPYWSVLRLLAIVLATIVVVSAIAATWWAVVAPSLAIVS